MNRRANQLARYLLRRGLRAEAVVGLFLERSLESVIAMLAVLKAGGCYVPLDPGQPAARLRHVFQIAQPQLVVSRRRWLGRLAQHCDRSRIVSVDRKRRSLARESSADLEIRVSPENAAYLIFTSGSTGRPKGVVGLHRGVVNRLHALEPLDPDERCCHRTSLSFVDAVSEILAPLVGGVPCAVVSDSVALDPSRLVGLLSSQQITRLLIVPSLLQVLLERYPKLGEQLPALECLVSSGEALSAGLVRRLMEALPRRRLLNLYGCSEAAGDSTWELVSEHQRPGVVGRPLANSRAYVVDRWLEPAGVGVVGEIYVSGVGLARGYFREPAFTAERFVPDWLSGESGKRLYRTGDLGRLLPDGRLDLAGRADHQIKVRGQRVEPQEIEAALLEHEQVQQAVVVAARVDGDVRLVAYVVVAAEIGGDVLKRYLRTRLPSALVPAQVVVLDAVPRTASGKLDRLALAEGASAATALNAEAMVTAQSIEAEMVAGIWEDLLGRQHVGADEDFFALGGHSLMAVRVLSRIRDVFGVELPVRALFERPTVAGLAEQVRAARGGIPVAESTPLVAVRREASLPLSFAQRRLWFLQQLAPRAAPITSCGYCA